MNAGVESPEELPPPPDPTATTTTTAASPAASVPASGFHIHRRPRERVEAEADVGADTDTDPDADPEAEAEAPMAPTPRPGRSVARPAGRASSRTLDRSRGARRPAATRAPRPRRARDRPALRPASRRSRRAAQRSLDRSGIRQAVALQAFLSFAIVRCSIVPAFDSLMPSTFASSALERPAVKLQRDQLAVARGQRCEGRPHGGPPQRHLCAVLRRGGFAVLRVGYKRGQAPTPTQLVERRVTRDPEHPGTLFAASAIERSPTAVGPLKRERGHILGARAIAQQGEDVRIDVVSALSVQRLESLPRGPRSVCGSCCLRPDHILTTVLHPIHHMRGIFR